MVTFKNKIWGWKMNRLFGMKFDENGKIGFFK